MSKSPWKNIATEKPVPGVPVVARTRAPRGGRDLQVCVWHPRMGIRGSFAQVKFNKRTTQFIAVEAEEWQPIKGYDE
jgi:hypothetical protein